MNQLLSISLLLSIVTVEPLGPRTDPLTTIKFLSAKPFKYLKVFNLHVRVPHLTRHAHSFEYTSWVRSRSDRSWRTHSVVLTVSCLSNTTKVVTFNNPWKPLPFDVPTTATNSPSSKMSTNTVSPRFKSASNPLNSAISTFGSVLAFLKWPFNAFGVFFSFDLQTQLNSLVTISVLCFHLSDNTRTSFYHCAWHCFTLGTVYASHSDFSTNYPPYFNLLIIKPCFTYTLISTSTPLGSSTHQCIYSFR